MSDFIYVDVEPPKLTEAEVSKVTARLVEMLTGQVPHNLLSHLRVMATNTDRGSRLEPALGAISMGALLQRAARRQYGLAIIDALLAWASARGWRASVVLEGHRGKQPLPDEEVRECSVEAALASRPKGPYVIRIRSRDAA
jgi:hypothetical protein